jgi:hypothetical protein
MDPDPDPAPDPAIFVTDLQKTNKKQFLYKIFLLITVLFDSLKVHLHHFSKIKSHKEVTKQ